MRRSFPGQLKELNSQIIDRGDDQRPVEELIMLLARGFGNQEAPVTGRTMKESALMRVGRFMLGTDRIIRAQFPDFKSLANVFVDATRERLPTA